MPERRGHDPKQARSAWPRRFHIRHGLGYLLGIEAFAIFGLAPLIDVGIVPHALLGVTFTLILIAGVVLTDLRGIAGKLLLAVVAVMLPVQLWRYAAPNEFNLVVHPIGLILFLVLLSVGLARTVFRSERIGADQVLGGVVLYLNIGLTFAVVYALVSHLSPGAFSLPTPAPERPLHPSYFAYFSFVTLTTVGYGDTVPVQAVAKSLATLEAALGQLYPAIILARLVSIEVSQREAKLMAKNRQKEAEHAHGTTGKS